jgi:hypothetical protein
VNASQNVGIGTSSPSYKLDVSGSGRVTTSFSVGGAPTGYGVLQAISDDANTAPRQISIRGTTNGNKNLFLGFNTTSDYGAIQAIIDGTGTVPLVLQPSGGNLGLGVTPSAWGSNWRAINFGYTSGIGQLAATSGGSGEVSLVSSAYNNNTNWLYYYTGAQASKYSQTSGQHQWFTAGTGTAGNAISFTQAMTLDASGNLGIGTSSPAYKLNIVEAKTLTPTTGDGQITIDNSTSGQVSAILFSSQATRRAQISAGLGGSGNDGFLAFTTRNDSTGFGERARIDSSGNLLVGVTSGSVHTLSKNNSNDIAAQINNTSSSNCYGLRIQTTAVASNSASFYLLRCADSSATRADIRADGGLANYSANNANLSDQRVKTDIQDAGGYLAKICAIPVRTFKYKDQTDDLLNLGCIAQEVEAVAPELVDPSGFGETPDDGVPLKAIYQTDLQYALMKCIQEQQALIQSLKARLDAANL